MFGPINHQRDVWRTVGANDLYLRFRAPTRFVLLSEYTDSEHIALGVPSSDRDGYEATIDVYRYRILPNEPAPTWRTGIDALASAQGWQELDLQPPIGHPASGFAGKLSTFRCLVPERGKWIVGAVWTATVGGDHIAVIYRCALEREPMMRGTMGGVLDNLAVRVRPVSYPDPSSAPSPVAAASADSARSRRSRGHGRGPIPWHNIAVGALMLPIFLLVSVLGIRDGRRITESENASISTLALQQGMDGAPTGTPVAIGAQYVGESIVALSAPAINFALPDTVSPADTSDSPRCACFVGGTARLVVCNELRGKSLYEDWDSLRRTVVVANARNNISDVLDAPHQLVTSEGITGVEGIIRYSAEADGAAIEQWQMIGVTPVGEQFSVFYLTGLDRPLNASPMSPDHLIRDTITVNTDYSRR